MGHGHGKSKRKLAKMDDLSNYDEVCHEFQGRKISFYRILKEGENYRGPQFRSMHHSLYIILDNGVECIVERNNPEFDKKLKFFKPTRSGPLSHYGYISFEVSPQTIAKRLVAADERSGYIRPKKDDASEMMAWAFHEHQGRYRLLEDNCQDFVRKVQNELGCNYTHSTSEVPSGEYKLRNAKWQGPLFGGDGTDACGDHWAWIEPNADYENNGKERWHIERQEDGTYKLRNGKRKGPLFCGDGHDGTDHWAWVEPNPEYENQGKERWRIELQEDGTYKLFNVKWGGPLFCGDGTDASGDHWAWVEPTPKYENKGKERWHLQRLN